MACSEGTPAVILVAMEVAAAIPMVITTKSQGGLVSDAAMQPQPSDVPPFAPYWPPLFDLAAI
jgi:hypothetical protein